MSRLRLSDLRDWDSYLHSVRKRLDLSSFETAPRGAEKKIADRIGTVYQETSERIAEGMLSIVVAPRPLRVSMMCGGDGGA